MSANSNELLIEPGGEVEYAYAAYTTNTSDATSNRLTIKGEVTMGASGAIATSNAIDNHVVVENTALVGAGLTTLYVGGLSMPVKYRGSLVGGQSSSGSANNNTVTIAGDLDSTDVYGGDGSSTAIGNEVAINDALVDGEVWGGRGSHASSNIVTITNGIVTNGMEASKVTGGKGSTIAQTNKVTLNDSTVRGDVTGGLADYHSDSASAMGNTVTITGRSMVRGNVAGGKCEQTTTVNCKVVASTVTLAGSSTVLGDVSGGECNPTIKSCTTDYHTLNVQGKGLTVGGSVKSFKTLNLTLPPDITNGDTMLEVGGDVDFTGATSDLTISGTPALRRGDDITLIKVTGNATFPPGLHGKTFYVGGYSIGVGIPPSDPKTLKAWVMDAPTTTYGINIAPGITGGEVKCNVAAGVGATSVGEGGDVTCEAAPESGNKLAALVISGGGVATPIICTASPCTLPSAQGDVTVYATFTKDDSGSTPGGGTPGSTDPGTGTNPGTGGGTDGNGDGSTQTPCPACDNSSPTMGELGLLLSGIALAGAAAPALRRREKQGKKADTRQ